MLQHRTNPDAHAFPPVLRPEQLLSSLRLTQRSIVIMRVQVRAFAGWPGTTHVFQLDGAPSLLELARLHLLGVSSMAQPFNMHIIWKLCQSDTRICQVATPNGVRPLWVVRPYKSHLCCAGVQMATVSEKKSSSSSCGQPWGQRMEQAMTERTLTRFWSPNVRFCCAAVTAVSFRWACSGFHDRLGG